MPDSTPSTPADPTGSGLGTPTTRLSLTEADSADRVATAIGIADAAAGADRVDPFNEQTRLDLATRRRTAHLALLGRDAVAAAVTGHGELDLVVDPKHRARGWGSATLSILLPRLEPDVTAWSHGDHPAARALAERHGFVRVRTLLRLVLPDLRAAVAGVAAQPREGIRIAAFDHEQDAADWLALNALTFAHHPEQGRMTAADLAEREAEDWFDADDLLVARDADGRMVGYHWMKLEQGDDEGEVYVLGVRPDTHGTGLGRALLAAGLRHMSERGRTRASLYVEGDNAPALALYRRCGFIADRADVQYRRING